MTKVDVLKLISGEGFIPVSTDIAKVTGILPALIYGQLIRSFNHFKIREKLTIIDGKEWFYMTADTMEEYVMIPERTQRTYIKTLVEHGLVEVKMHGLPAKRHFHITNKIYEWVQNGFPEVVKEKQKRVPTKNGKISRPDEINVPEQEEAQTLDIDSSAKSADKERQNQPTNKEYLNKDLKDFEEEEEILPVVTESDVINLMNAKIAEREITNEKTIKAILVVSSKCKAIGTMDHEAMENYVITVVEEKMSKLGQKQSVKQRNTGNSGNGGKRKEQVPEWLEEQRQQASAGQADKQEQPSTAELEEQRRQLEEEVLKKYKK